MPLLYLLLLYTSVGALAFAYRKYRRCRRYEQIQTERQRLHIQRLKQEGKIPKLQRYYE